MCSILFPSQSPFIGDPGGVTHIIHIGFDLRKVFGSMSLNRIMFHPDHVPLYKIRIYVSRRRLCLIYWKNHYIIISYIPFCTHLIWVENRLDMKSDS